MSDQENSSKQIGINKKTLITVASIVILGLTASILISFTTNFADTVAKIAAARWDFFAVPFLIYFLAYFIDMSRIRFVSKNLGYAISKREAFYNSVIGCFGSNITPSATGGQPFQVYHLSKLGMDAQTATNITASRYVEYVIFSTFMVLAFIWRIFDIIGAGLIGAKVLIVGLVVSTIMSILMISIFLNVRILFRIIEFVEGIIGRKHPEKSKARIQKIEAWINELKESISFLWKKRTLIVLFDFVLGAIIVMLQAFSVHYVLTFMTSGTLSYFDSLLVFCLLNYSAYYLPTPGSAGGVEGVFSIVYVGLYNDASGVAAGVFIWRFATFYLHLFFQLAYVFAHKTFIAHSEKGVKRLSFPILNLRKKRENKE